MDEVGVWGERQPRVGESPGMSIALLGSSVCSLLVVGPVEEELEIQQQTMIDSWGYLVRNVRLRSAWISHPVPCRARFNLDAAPCRTMQYDCIAAAPCRKAMADWIATREHLGIWASGHLDSRLLSVGLCGHGVLTH